MPAMRHHMAAAMAARLLLGIVRIRVLRNAIIPARAVLMAAENACRPLIARIVRRAPLMPCLRTHIMAVMILGESGSYQENRHQDRQSEKDSLFHRFSRHSGNHLFYT